MKKRRASPVKNIVNAAKTAIALQKEADVSGWIGTGPSIRARARFAMLVAFIVAGPTLFIGVQRSEDVSVFANSLVDYDQFWEKVSVAQLAVSDTRSALWHFKAEPEIQNERRLNKSIRVLGNRVGEITAAKPKEFQTKFMALLETLTLNLDRAFAVNTDPVNEEEELAHLQSLSGAVSALDALEEDLSDLEREVAGVVYERRKNAVAAMSRVSRDQILLFLLLLFSIPIFLLFVPAWIVSPLVRLKQIEHRIEEGSIRELAINGRDEVAQLGRAIKEALMWREELDARKSVKIFEIRNVLRAVIARVNEPVLIIDRTARINYANHPASVMLQVETHNLEGSGLADNIISQELAKLVGEAMSGDINEEGVNTRLEFRDGRSVTVLARLSAVHDRAGNVSRVVIVLVPEVT